MEEEVGMSLGSMLGTLFGILAFFFIIKALWDGITKHGKKEKSEKVEESKE